jgi:hypothetical protein
MELPPLAAAAAEMLRLLAAEGVETRVAMAEMDKRFFVYHARPGRPPAEQQPSAGAPGRSRSSR